MGGQHGRAQRAAGGIFRHPADRGLEEVREDLAPEGVDRAAAGNPDAPHRRAHLINIAA